jgi:transcriptional regulator with XRE-family HTH domain
MKPVTFAQVRMGRAALNWSVRDLAAATGLHRNTITNIEVGRYAGDAATLAAIKDVLTREGSNSSMRTVVGRACAFESRQKENPGNSKYLPGDSATSTRMKSHAAGAAKRGATNSRVHSERDRHGNRCSMQPAAGSKHVCRNRTGVVATLRGDDPAKDDLHLVSRSASSTHQQHAQCDLHGTP